MASRVRQDATKNTIWHKTGTSLNQSYFPYQKALATDRKSLDAGHGILANLLREVNVAQLKVEAVESLVAAAELERERFSRVAPGWQHADEKLQKLRQSYVSSQLNLQQLRIALDEQQNQRRPQPAAWQIWEAAAQPDYQQHNTAGIVQDRVDVRKINYFVQDNRGQLIENVYLPDIEPKSPRKASFFAPKAEKQGSPLEAKFGLWVPNPTFHKAVRRSTGHWFGAGGLQLDSQTEYLEKRQSERLETPAASFLLRPRPDVLSSIPYKLLEQRPAVWVSKPQSEGVEAMLTARRGFLPLPTDMQLNSSQKAPAAPSGAPVADDVLLGSPHIMQAGATDSLNSPYALESHDILSVSHTHRGACGGGSGETVETVVSAEHSFISRADDSEVQFARALIHPSEIKEAQRSPRDEKKYFHSERRGKVTGVSSPRQTQFNSSCHDRPSSIHSLQHWDEGLGVDVLASSAGTWDWGEGWGVSRSGGEVLREEEEERRRQEQDVLREERARQLTRRVSLPAWKSVHHMPAAFMPQVIANAASFEEEGDNINRMIDSTLWDATDTARRWGRGPDLSYPSHLQTWR